MKLQTGMSERIGGIFFAVVVMIAIVAALKFNHSAAEDFCIEQIQLAQTRTDSITVFGQRHTIYDPTCGNMLR